MKASTILLILLCFFSEVKSQVTLPASGEIFRDDVVPRIDITLPADSFAAIMDPANMWSDYHYHATFVFDNGNLRDTVENIGFRLRGNTSRQSGKKSFKVSFNTYQPGRDYHGLEKLNLNGEHNDPTIARSKVCWDFLREIEVGGSRSNHVELYVNGQYMGLYINVEHIDENFVRSRFGNNGGNLYKCLWPATLEYLGSDPDLYKVSQFGRRTYELKINTGADDYSDLAAFIDVLNNEPLASLPCELEKVFNVNSYLKVIAFDILTGNWDGPIYNKNNFYLYHNTATGKFEYIPFDLDNTFGIDWAVVDWGRRNIYGWSFPGEPRPIYNRLMQVPEYRDRVSYYFDQYLTQYFRPSVMNPILDALRIKIRPSAIPDTFRSLDYGYTLQDFDDAFEQPLTAHVKYGLKDFIKTRRTSALSQLIVNDISPIIPFVRHNHPGPGQPFTLTIKPEDETRNLTVELIYQLNGGANQMLPLRDDGTQGDSIAGDGIWSVQFTPSITTGNMNFYVSATDSLMKTTREPHCDWLQIAINPDVPDLRINEFLASNDSVLADNFGEYDDWIELYNADANDVFLGDLYLTDDLGDPQKWQLPPKTMRPGTYLLIWADGDGFQGDDHANFKLSASGEQIGIFGSQTMSFAPIDTLTYGPQQTDITYGRLPNGTGPFGPLAFASPNRNNEFGLSIEEPFLSLQIGPNPFSDYLTFSWENIPLSPVSLTIFDLRGTVIFQKRLPATGFRWDGKNGQDLPVSTGIYFAKIEQKGKVKVVKIIRR